MSPLSLSLLIILGLLLCVFLLSWRHWKKALQSQSQRSQDALSEAKALSQTESTKLLDALPDGVLTVSSEGRILRTNAKARTTFGDRSLDGRALEEALLETALISPIRTSLKTGLAQTELITLPSGSLPGTSAGHSGESHWLLQISPVRTDADSNHLLVLLRDVSDSMQSNQIRKDFVANASHELRTPLAIIGGYLENLLEDDLLEEPENARHVLGIMDKHVSRINRIVEDMLVISKLESGEATALKLTLFQVEDCIKDVLERLDPLIKQQDATVTIKLADPALILEGDRFYWTQLLFNLVENALKQNSAIAVSVQITAESDVPGELLLAVSDNGVGIPASDLPYIFKRFFRVEKHHGRGDVKGTGLGLSIVKRAVEAHGGDISATSTPGVETRFAIRVPLKQADPQE
jgi:two-component system phosphate regulon sensor histidine kinase PhoR